MGSGKETNLMMKRIWLFGISYCVLAVVLFPQSMSGHTFQLQADITPTPEQNDSLDEISINGGLAWSPNGDFLAVGTTAGVAIHQAHDLSLYTRIAEHLVVSALDWGVSNQIVIGAESGVMEIWNMEEKLFELRGHTGPIESVEFSPDGEWIASSGYDGQALLWDAQTGDLKQSIVPSEYFSYHPVDWGADSRYVVTRLISQMQAEIMVWNVNSEQIHLSWRNQTDTSALKWSPSGEWIAAGRSDAIVLWDAATGTLSRMMEDERWSVVDALAWSPDSQRLASVSSKYNENGDEIYYTFPLRVHDFTTEETFLLADDVIITGDAFYANAIAWSPDGSQLAAVSDDGKVFIWDVRSRVLLATYEDYESILLPGFKVRSGITPVPPHQPLSLIAEDTCNPPCIFGLQPGISTTTDVRNLFEGEIGDEILGANLDLLTGEGWFPFNWKISYWQQEWALIDNMMYFSNGVLERLEILMNRPTTLREALVRSGSPSLVLGQSDLDTALFLLYPQIGLKIYLINYDGTCTLDSMEDTLVVRGLDYYIPDQLKENLQEFDGNTKVINSNLWDQWLNSTEAVTCYGAVSNVEEYYQSERFSELFPDLETPPAES